MELLIHAILSVFFGFSLAVLLVEKGDDFPIKFITKPLRWLFAKISTNLEDVLLCTVCCSFWCSGIGELVLFFWFTHHFMWPFTGVITLGITWFVIDLLNAIDKSK